MKCAQLSRSARDLPLGRTWGPGFPASFVAQQGTLSMVSFMDLAARDANNSFGVYYTQQEWEAGMQFFLSFLDDTQCIYSPPLV